MRVMSAGEGYRYLLSSVAAGDGHRSLTTPLIRYYTEKGCPPGSWLGTGVHGLGTRNQRIEVGKTVTEDHLRRLLGQGRDPITGEALGLPYFRHKTVEQRIAARVEHLAPDLDADDRATAVTAALDPDLAGRVFTIRAPMHKTYATARRLPLQELSS